LRPGDPHEAGGAHFVAAPVAGGRQNLVRPGDGRHELERRRAVSAGRHRAGRAFHRDVLDLPRPHGAAVLVFFLHAGPAPLDDLVADLLPGDRRAIPVHRDQVDGVGLACQADVLLRADADVDLALVDDHRRPPGDELVALVGD